jgi:catechol 2,3-dioxygenase-like lactoylglutathione lyase family enzyme
VILDHIGFNVSDFQKAKAFFEQALKPLGISAVAQGDGWAMMGRDRKPQFAAATREQVREFYKAALAAGGKENGAPGIRAQYHPSYYGAFVIGPDGHNIEAVCHHER